MAVEFPGKLVDASGSDLAKPLQNLLRKLGLLESEADALKGVGLVEGTPQSVQVIKAGALSVTKAWTTLTAGAGVAGAVSTLIGALKAGPDDVQIALVSGASIILAATALAIALIVRGDVGGRAATSVELYRARAEVAGTFLAAALAANRTTTGARNGSSPNGGDALADLLAAIEVDVPGQDASPGLYGIRKRPGRKPLEIRRGDGDWVPLANGSTYELELPLPSAS